MFFADLRRLARREVTFAEIDMAAYLPRKHLSRHNLAFAERFLVCVLTVARKLREPGVHEPGVHEPGVQWLACTAEERALRP